METAINQEIHDQSAELEAMRAQMRQLRDRLDTQQIVSDRMFRNTIEQGARFSRRMFRMQSLVLLPIGVLSMLYLQWMVNVPVWFVILTIFFFAVSIVMDWHTTRLGVMDYGAVPLLEMQQRFVRQKRLRARRMLGGMIFLAVWLPLFVYVLMYDIQPVGMGAADVEDMRTGMFIGGAVGGVVGLWFGISAYLRMQRESQNAVDSIRAYMDEGSEVL